MSQINPNDVIEQEIIYNITNLNEQVQQVGIDLTIKNRVVLEHGQFHNVELNEKFDMQQTFGLIRVRSSFSRKGIQLSSGVFDPGFKGVGGVSIYNFSGHQIIIEAGTRIGQMIVFNANPASLYNGYYNNTESVESKYNE